MFVYINISFYFLFFVNYCNVNVITTKVSQNCWQRNTEVTNVLQIIGEPARFSFPFVPLLRCVRSLSLLFFPFCQRNTNSSVVCVIYGENKYLLIYRLVYVVHFSNTTMVQRENAFNGFQENYCVLLF